MAGAAGNAVRTVLHLVWKRCKITRKTEWKGRRKQEMKSLTSGVLHHRILRWAAKNSSVRCEAGSRSDHLGTKWQRSGNTRKCVSFIMTTRYANLAVGHDCGRWWRRYESVIRRWVAHITTIIYQQYCNFEGRQALRYLVDINVTLPTVLCIVVVNNPLFTICIYFMTLFTTQQSLLPTSVQRLRGQLTSWLYDMYAERCSARLFSPVGGEDSRSAASGGGTCRC